MGHVCADIELTGQRSRKTLLRNTLVDTGATYTVVESSVIETIRAFPLPGRVRLELGNGKRVRARAYAAVVGIGSRRGPAIVLTSRGAKSACERTESGPRLLYCQESPENWFEDFGSATLAAGQALVALRADFREVVTIDESNPMLVFLQSNTPGLGNLVAVPKKDGSGFRVQAEGGTISDGTFSYRVVAKRRYYENLRMTPFPAAYNDRYLYPENFGRYPHDVYVALKGEEPPADYYDNIADFTPNESSPWNNRLPEDWRARVQAARERYPSTLPARLAPPSDAEIPAESEQQRRERINKEKGE